MPNPFHKDETAQEISEVNVVPLADVSLVLLIIMLLLSPMMAQSMLHVRTAAKAADDPAPFLEESSPREKPPELVLVVDLGPGGIAVGERLFATPPQLMDFLRTELPRRGDRKVFLAPAPDVTHGAVVDLLETIRLAGASSVALVQTVEGSR